MTTSSISYWHLVILQPLQIPSTKRNRVISNILYYLRILPAFFFKSNKNLARKFKRSPTNSSPNLSQISKLLLYIKNQYLYRREPIKYPLWHFYSKVKYLDNVDHWHLHHHVAQHYSQTTTTLASPRRDEEKVGKNAVFSFFLGKSKRRRRLEKVIKSATNPIFYGQSKLLYKNYYVYE